MKRIALSVMTIPLLMGLAVGAANFWEIKPHQEWTQAEVRTILTQSPWCQTLRVAGAPSGFDWGGGSRPEAGTPGAVPGGAGGGAPLGTGGTDVGGVPRTGARGEDVLTESSAQPGETTYYVIWSSAKTVRRALTRQQVLREMATPEQAEAVLTQPMPNYTITIFGSNLSAFEQVDEETLKAQTYFLAKKRKDMKVQAQEVQISRAGPYERIATVTFVFPRELESGEPLLLPEEKKVEFHCEVREPRIKIKASFDLKRMTLEGVPDL